jgi:hypothetical protein
MNHSFKYYGQYRLLGELQLKRLAKRLAFIFDKMPIEKPGSHQRRVSLL